MRHTVDALKNTILTCAITHLIILGIYAISTGNLNLINGFDILDFDLFFPDLGKGAMNFLLSYVVISCIFFYYYQQNSSKKRNN